ncbi:MAG: MerR family transcriptional regulator [Turicibacter sp.]|nr:MerR family transcriptional regulator [Turicibacter sp.]
MEYTINKLAKMAGISTRTLRYYDEYGLLKPARARFNGYRIYGQREVDRLQHILFYRELGVPLGEIRKILQKDFNGMDALQNHLTALLAKRTQLNRLIANVEKSILAQRGEVKMTDREKLSGFAEKIDKIIADNEGRYGEEIRTKYGSDTVDRSNAKIKGMSQEDFEKVEKLREEFNAAIKAAFEEEGSSPKSRLAQKACELHKEWLCYFWDNYSKEAHTGVAQMYVDDTRFTAHFDEIAPGITTFLRDAVAIYCKTTNA